MGGGGAPPTPPPPAAPARGRGWPPPPPSTLWLAQTPQVFRRLEFLELLERAEAEGITPTDDSALYERFVGPVPIAAGDASNLKITRPADLELAAALMKAREEGTSR